MEKQEQEERKHIEALDRKIERLQEKVIKKHKEYSVLAEELSTLLDERHPERKIERVKQMLYDAYVESERSLDEIIDLIRNADEWIQAGFSCKISGSSQIVFKNLMIQKYVEILRQKRDEMSDISQYNKSNFRTDSKIIWEYNKKRE